MNGTTLLADFRKSRSESAFGDLVRRYTNLVYSVARRRTGNDSLAQEVTQLVFIRLARTSPRLQSDAELVAWLHRTTVNASIDLWRSETRRRTREEHAVAMQLTTPNDDTWHALAPALDEALNDLPEGDRQTLLLRYFHRQSMRDIGSAFEISEDAAKMRVSRALERLRDQLARYGVTCGVAALGAVLTERAVEAAPISFAEVLAAARYPAAAGAAAMLGFFLAASKTKLAVGLAAALLVGGGLLLSLRTNQIRTALGRDGRPPVGAGVESAQTASPPAADVPVDASTRDAAEPDPLMLLLRVAQARQRLDSGTMEFTLFSERLNKPVRETNYIRFKTTFDGSKRWLESFGREYSYARVGSDASQLADPIIEAQGLDREGAVRAGLLKPFEAHIVTASDGTNWMKYRESDGRRGSVNIDDPNASSKSADYFFDFRCLGLRAWLTDDSTVEGCLGYIRAKSIKLVGREPVNGTDAWHVRVIPSYDQPLDYWIDVARPDRLLKQAEEQGTVVSQYDPASNDPIPVQVHTKDYLRSKLWGTKHFTRTYASFNEPVDPALWSLAGLGIPIGADVVDLRVHQIIGYWNGVGLSSSPPRSRPSRKGEPLVEPAPVDRRELLATLETAPESDEGLSAAEWILLNTPDGPEVERAAEAVRQHHLASPRLGRLAKELERFRHRSAKPLLEGMLADNPRIEIRAVACFALATMLRDECKHGQDQKKTAEAESMLERVIREFGSVQPEGPTLAHRAQRDLGELRAASIGKPAPDFVTTDFEGQSLRLSDLRGQVVVLTFWTCHPEKDNHRALEETAAGKPAAFIGIINCDDALEKIRATFGKENVTGRTVWARDVRDGPVSTAWYVRGWPTVVVIDPAGTIRYRGSYSNELHKLLKELLGG